MKDINIILISFEGHRHDFEKFEGKNTITISLTRTHNYGKIFKEHNIILRSLRGGHKNISKKFEGHKHNFEKLEGRKHDFEKFEGHIHNYTKVEES